MDRLPIGIERRMVEHVAIKRQLAATVGFVHGQQGAMLEDFICRLLARRRRGSAIAWRDPGKRPVHRKSAADIWDLVEKTPRGHMRHDAFEVRRALERGKPLHRAEIRAAIHRDLSVRPGLSGDPFDGVVAVLAFREIEVEVPARKALPAGVLECNGVAVVDVCLELVAFIGRPRLHVWRADEDGREWPFALRETDIRGKLDAVAHFHALIGEIPPARAPFENQLGVIFELASQ